MRLLFFVFLLAGFISSCNKPQSFDYRGMQHLKIDSVGLLKSRISLELIYFNPNNFGADLRNVNCDIYINHNYLGKFVLDTLMHIPKRSEFIVRSSMQVDMKNIYRNTLNTILSNQILVQLKGTTKVGKGGVFINFPFSYSAMESFSMF